MACKRISRFGWLSFSFTVLFFWLWMFGMWCLLQFKKNPKCNLSSSPAPHPREKGLKNDCLLKCIIEGRRREVVVRESVALTFHIL